MQEFSFTTFPEITTERLTLRQLEFSDKKAIFRLRSSKEINSLITRETPKNLNEAEAFIQVCHDEFEKGNRIFWAMELNDSKNVIGTIVFHRISEVVDYAEIGYELDPSFHKRGYMSEAMDAIIAYGIDTMKIKVIEAFTHQNNIASIALLEKHQFIFQPERKDGGFENNRIFRREIKNN